MANKLKKGGNRGGEVGVVCATWWQRLSTLPNEHCLLMRSVISQNCGHSGYGIIPYGDPTGPVVFNNGTSLCYGNIDFSLNVTYVCLMMSKYTPEVKTASPL